MIQFSMESVNQDHTNLSGQHFLIDESGITTYTCNVGGWAMKKPTIMSSHSIMVVVRVVYGHRGA